jgi:hypothetical protein
MDLTQTITTTSPKADAEIIAALREIINETPAYQLRQRIEGFLKLLEQKSARGKQHDPATSAIKSPH